MSAKKFYQVLTELTKLGWKALVSSIGWIRLQAPGGARYSYTPMTAVCFFEKQRNFHWLKDEEAGKKLGLSKAMVTRMNQLSFGKTDYGMLTLFEHLDVRFAPKLRRT